MGGASASILSVALHFVISCLSLRPYWFAAKSSVQAFILSIFCHEMKSSLQRRNTRFVTLFSVLLFSLLIPPNAAGAVPNTNLSPGDWKSILTNDQGRDACSLKEWLASPGCRKDASGADNNTRRALISRDDLSASACQCTVAYFNVLCGCLLSNGSSLADVNYTQWKNNCEGSGFTANQNTSWIDHQGQHIPEWAYIAPNALTFDSARVLRVIDRMKRWSTIQIVLPIITVISTLALLGLVYLFLHHRRRWKAQPQHGRCFLAFIRKALIPRSQSVKHPGRNDTWQIDDHGRGRSPSDQEADTESFFMVPNAHHLVESPTVERSYWSPATNSPRHNRLRAPSHRGRSAARPRMPYASTMRSVQDRVRHLMPWITHPRPVTNIRPGRRYVIDGDQSSVKTRSGTLSSLSSRKPKDVRYQTIDNGDDEYMEIMGGAGGASTVGHGRGARPGVTDSDRDAVAGSVILIGDRDFTLDSHSSGPRQGTKSSVAFARGHDIEGILKTPESAHPNPNVQVEPPSPTLDLHLTKTIPISPGAPPLLPPPPQERPPLPPIKERSTPRRTPSPHLQIATEFDSRNVSKNTFGGKGNAGITTGTEDKNSRLRLSFAGDSQYQRDPSTSSRRNALSYASISSDHHHHHQPSFDDSHNAGAYLAAMPERGRDSSFSQRHRSGSGSRRLSQHYPELLASHLGQHHPNMSPSQVPVSRTPAINEGSVSPNRYLPQPKSNFDPYEGIRRANIPLRPNRLSDVNVAYAPQRHGHSSSVSLPRSPGEPEGQLQRGWSADDEMDRASLLIDQQPMEIDNGMSGVYIAAPRDVATIGRPGEGPRHWANPSAESFATAISGGDGGRPMSIPRFEPESPTLSMLEKDVGTRPGFATYAGHASVSGSSGWDASTQGHGRANASSPIGRPSPLPTSSNQRPSSSGINVNSVGVEALGHGQNGFGNHSFLLASSGSRSASPSLGHIRNGSDMSINGLSQNRSREDILSPPKNDPLRLFPDSVRAAGYTIGLRANAAPVPPRSPRPHEFGSTSSNANTSLNGNSHNRSEGSGSHDDNADDQHHGRATTNGVTGSGPMAGYIERAGTQQSGGGTWGTESSGVQTILEAIQQLPERFNPRREGQTTSPGIESRTPPKYTK